MANQRVRSSFLAGRYGLLRKIRQAASQIEGPVRGALGDERHICAEFTSEVKNVRRLSSPHYHLRQALIVLADACEAELGGALVQGYAAGNENAVFYIFKSLSKAQGSYRQTEIDVLALVTAVERLKKESATSPGTFLHKARSGHRQETHRLLNDRAGHSRQNANTPIEPNLERSAE